MSGTSALRPLGQFPTRVGAPARPLASSLRDAAWRVMEQLSLRAQIGLMAGALCIVLVGVVSTAAAWVGREEAAAGASARMAQLASELSHRLDSSMAQRYREIGTLAGLAPLRAAWATDPASLRDTLEQLRAAYPSYAWIGFARPDGVIAAATGGLLEGRSVAKRPWFSAGLQAPTVSDLHEALLLAELLAPGRDQGAEPLRFFDIAFPVKDEAGRTVGVLGAHLYSRWIAEVRDTFASLADATQRGDGAHTEFQVLEADGKVIAGPGAGLDDSTLAQLRRDGTVSRTVAEDGETYLESLATTHGERDFPGFGWIVGARQPAEYAFGGVRAVALTMVGIGVLAAIAGAGCSYLVAAGIARPIQRLCEEAERVGRSPNGAKLQRIGGSRELVLLSHSLRSLVRRLGLVERRRVVESQRASHSSANLHRQMENLRRLAQSDPLTGLLNRRGFLDAVANGKDPGEPRTSGVLLMDIDHFKRVNDRFGHAVGDAVICAVAEVIRASARHSEVTARFGGEEFVLFAADADQPAMAVLAERIRKAVQQAQVGSTEAVSVTLSIGVAIHDPQAADIQDTIDRADMALYAAKEAGRNRVCFAEPARVRAVAG